MMSTLCLMSISLVTSSLLCLFLNSWVSLWVFLEINTLSFCSMGTSNLKMTQKSKSSLMKYFIIQSITSALLLLVMVTTKTISVVSFLLMSLGTSVLLIKMGAAPFHQWFINLSKKMEWPPAFTLFTWQKMIPTYLLIFQLKKIILPFLISSAIFGSLFIFNKTNLKEILGFSSVFNLSWILLALLLNTKVFFQFLALYWISLAFPIFLFHKKDTSTLKELKEEPLTKSWILLSLASLAGMPPMLGFLAKWLTLSQALSFSFGLLVILLLTLSAINMYIYFRILNPTSLANSKNNQKNSNINSKTWLHFFILLNFTSIFFLLP